MQICEQSLFHVESRFNGGREIGARRERQTDRNRRELNDKKHKRAKDKLQIKFSKSGIRTVNHWTKGHVLEPLYHKTSTHNEIPMESL